MNNKLAILFLFSSVLLVACNNVDESQKEKKEESIPKEEKIVIKEFNKNIPKGVEVFSEDAKKIVETKDYEIEFLSYRKGTENIEGINFPDKAKDIYYINLAITNKTSNDFSFKVDKDMLYTNEEKEEARIHKSNIEFNDFLPAYSKGYYAIKLHSLYGNLLKELPYGDSVRARINIKSIISFNEKENIDEDVVLNLQLPIVKLSEF